MNSLSEGTSSTLLLRRILDPEWPRPDPVPLMKLIAKFANTISPLPEVIDLLSVTANYHAIPKPRNGKVVYVGGSWDCFGSGHVEYLSRAKALYPADTVVLVVGIWSDEVSNNFRISTTSIDRPLHDRMSGKPRANIPF